MAVPTASIIFSAGTYLFDFGSNIIVLVQYSTLYSKYLRLDRHSRCDVDCRHQKSELTGYFYALIAILICSHTCNALLFVFKFKKREAPLLAAYFLPLIHLWRLLNLFWTTLNYKGVKLLRSEEMNGLYGILGTALEGIPLLILEFCAYLVLTKVQVFSHTMSLTFKVSVVASLLSAAYNGGISVKSIAKNAVSSMQKLAVASIAGLFVSCATLARCLTYTNIILHIRQHFAEHRSLKSQAKFHLYDAIILFFLVGNVTSYWIFYWLLQFPKQISQSIRDYKRCLTSFTFSYMTIISGPLYPMVYEAKEHHQLGFLAFRIKFLIVATINILTDVVVLFLTFCFASLPIPYFATSLAASLGYIGSMVAYIELDKFCGPMVPQQLTSASVERADDITTWKNMEEVIEQPIAEQFYEDGNVYVHVIVLHGNGLESSNVNSDKKVDGRDGVNSDKKDDLNVNSDKKDDGRDGFADENVKSVKRDDLSVNSDKKDDGRDGLEDGNVNSFKRDNSDKKDDLNVNTDKKDVGFKVGLEGGNVTSDKQDDLNVNSDMKK